MGTMRVEPAKNKLEGSTLTRLDMGLSRFSKDKLEVNQLEAVGAFYHGFVSFSNYERWPWIVGKDAKAWIAATRRSESVV